MTKRIEYVTPEQFHAMQLAIVNAQARGHNPESCVSIACEAGGIEPPTKFEPVEIVVVPAPLNGDS